MATGVTNFPTSLDNAASILNQVNDCSSLLNSAITDSATSLDVVDASLFPTAGIARIEDEFIKWTGKSTNTLTGLTRGAYSSAAASHAAAADVRMTLMAGYHNVLADAMIAIETKIGTGSSTPTSGKALMGNGTGTSAWTALPTELIIACSDESTALTAGTSKVTFRMPYAMTVTAVRASLSTAQATDGGGGIFTVDINEGGTTILSTKLTIDNTEKTSTTAATPAVISDASLADDAEITVDIDQIGDGTAKGLKVILIGTR